MHSVTVPALPYLLHPCSRNAAMAWMPRSGLEKLLRYCDRSPFAMRRLHETCGNDDTLAYQLKNALPDGTTVILLNPLELIDRIAKLMPAPYTHRHRYFGVLAPNSPFRSQVIAMVGQRPDVFNTLPKNEKASEASKDDDNQKATGFGKDNGKQKTADDNKKNNDKTDDVSQKPADVKKRKRPLSCYLWAELLARFFGVNPDCPKCGKPMRVIAFIQSNESLHKILSHVGLPTEPPQYHRRVVLLDGRISWIKHHVLTIRSRSSNRNMMLIKQ